jgi:hypothetical protein
MPRAAPPVRSLAFAVLWCTAAGLMAAAMWQFGRNQMGGFDHSALVDTAWRIASSQKPYHDFYLTTPVAYYLGAGLSFELWGAKWAALVAISIVFAVLTFLIQTVSMRSLRSPGFSIAVPLVCELLAMGIASYWWYNSTTTIAVCVLLTASIALIDRPSSLLSAVTFTVATFLLMMMKPNAAGLAIAGVAIILMTIRGLRRQVIAGLLGGGVLLILLLAACQVSTLDVVRSYIEIAKTRAIPRLSNFFLDKPGEAYATIPLLITCMIPSIGGIRSPLAWARQRPANYWQVLMISGAGIVIGVFDMFANLDSNLVSGVTLVLVSSMNLVLWLDKEGVLNREVSVAIVLAMAAGAASTLIGVGFIGETPSAGVGLTSWWTCLIIAVVSLVLGLVYQSPARGSALSLGEPRILWFGLLILVGGVALFCGYERFRVRFIGPDAFYSAEPGVAISGLPFFEGFTVSPRLREVVEEIGPVLRQYEDEKRDGERGILFGPRMEFGYAAFRVPSPKGLPIWYHPGTSYPLERTQAVIDSFLSHEFELCVFLKTDDVVDFAYLPPEIIHSIETDYRRVNYPEIAVFYRKPPDAGPIRP